jgi:hypothetical protein
VADHTGFLGAVVSIEGELFRGICMSDRATVTFRSVERDRCSACGQEPDRTYVIGSPLFDREVQPVRTIAAGSNGSSTDD